MAEAVAVRRLRPPTPRVALVIAAAVVVGVVLYLGRSALAPFIVGALLIYLLDPAVGWVSRIRIGKRTVPRGLAVLIVYILAVVVVFYGLRLLLGPLVSQLLDPALVESVRGSLDRLGEIYRSLDIPPQVRQSIDDALAEFSSGAGGGFDLGALLPIARSIAGTLAGFFGFLIVPIWAFYILRDRVQLRERAFNSLPATWRDEVWTIVMTIERVFGRWIRGQILLGLIVGAATFAGLLALGWLIDPIFIRFAVLLAVIAGILELLPIIGPIIAMIPALLIALITRDPVAALIGVLVLYIAVQQLENAVLVPKIQGDAVDLHPSLVIFALIIGGAIAGLLGAILAIPITAAARDVYLYLFRRLSDDEVPTTEAQPPPEDPPPPPEDPPPPPADTQPPSSTARPPRRANRRLTPKAAGNNIDGPSDRGPK